MSTSNSIEKVTNGLYMREHSNVIRKFQRVKVDKMQENPIFHVEFGPNRVIIITMCRIRQRLLQQAWNILVEKTGVTHDYEEDARVILTRKLPEDELRTELEIEVLYKWISQTKDVDPTGIASTIFFCKKRSYIYTALQQLRLEFYEPGETVLFQGDLPRQEDGHFTIFRGECEVLQFPENSMPLLKLLYLAKKKKWDEAKKLLNSALVLAKIAKSSGFGELSTLTGVKRAATIRTTKNADNVVEIIVLPKMPLLDCLKAKRQSGVEGAAPSEAMDFLRQSGMANRISPKDLVLAAGSMIRRTLGRGEILYYKGQPARSIFLVVSGEFLLDTGGFMVEGTPQPFVNSITDNCYHLSSGSILGDEGVTGSTKRFMSTAAVVSDVALVFEAVGFGMNFLTEKIETLRYCALSYKDRSRWSTPLALAEQINPYTYFNSLRRCIAFAHPFRGTQDNIYGEEPVPGSPSKTNLNSPIKNTISRPTTKETERRSVATPKLVRTKSVLRTSLLQMPPAISKKLSIRRTQTGIAALIAGDNKSVEEQNIEGMGNGLGVLSLDEEERENHLMLEVKEWEKLNYPKVLSGVGIHHAMEINKQAKKSLLQLMKQQAKENILYEEMLKTANEESESIGHKNAERSLKKSVGEFQLRAEKKHKKMLEEEELRKQKFLNRSTSAIRFFTSLSMDEDDDHPNEPVVTIIPKAQGTTSQKSSVNGDNKVKKEGENNAMKKDEKSKTLKESVDHSLRRDSIISEDTNIISQEEFEREFNNKSKIEQYFIWMDHLNRYTYRQLIHQAQQTAENQHLHTDEKLEQNEQSMKKLNEIFQKFGLTPNDLNIPWKIESVPSTASSVHSVPSLDMTKKDARKQKSVELKENSKGSLMVVSGVTKDLINAKKKEAIVSGHYKSYNPSSWREEMIREKATKLDAALNKFQRSPIPDNRRVSQSYYHIAGLHHTDFVHHTDRKHFKNHTHGEENLGAVAEDDDVSELSHDQFKNLKRDGIDLDNNYPHPNTLDTPSGFLEAVEKVTFPVRKEFLPIYEWKTRFVKNSENPDPSEVKPMPKAVAREVPQEYDSFSKDAMLQKVRYIQAANRQIMSNIEEEEEKYYSNSVPMLSRQGTNISQLTQFTGMSGPTTSAYLKGLQKMSTGPIVQDSYQHELQPLLLPNIATTSLETLPSDTPNSVLHSTASSDSNQGKETTQHVVTVEKPENKTQIPVGRKDSDINKTKSKVTFDTNTKADQHVNIIAPTISHDSEAATDIAVKPTATNNANSFHLGAGRMRRRGSAALSEVSGIASVPSYSDRPQSQALSAYKSYMQADPTGRKFYEGKRKANAQTKFGLKSKNKKMNLDSIQLNTTSDAAKVTGQLVLNINKEYGLKKTNPAVFSGMQSEIALFNSLFPLSSPEQKKDFRVNLKASKGLPPSLVQSEETDHGAPKLWGDEILSLGLKSSSIDRASQFNSKDGENHDSDPEFDQWQQFTVDHMRCEKTGPKKTLPILSTGKDPTGLQKKHVSGRAKRWGGGSLVPLAAECEEAPIAGPPSYLDIHRKTFRVHSSVDDRKKIAEQLRMDAQKFNSKY